MVTCPRKLRSGQAILWHTLALEDLHVLEVSDVKHLENVPYAHKKEDGFLLPMASSGFSGAAADAMAMAGAGRGGEGGATSRHVSWQQPPVV